MEFIRKVTFLGLYYKRLIHSLLRGDSRQLSLSSEIEERLSFEEGHFRLMEIAYYLKDKGNYA
jgi:hypothetical protein